MSIFGSSRGAGPSYSRSQRSRTSRDNRIADLLRYALRLSGGTGAFVMSPTDRTKALHVAGLSHEAAASAAREVARHVGPHGEKQASEILLLPNGAGSPSSSGECVMVCEVICVIKPDVERAGRVSFEKGMIALARLVRREIESSLFSRPDAFAAGILRTRKGSVLPAVLSRAAPQRGLT